MENANKKSYKALALTLVIGLVIGGGVGSFAHATQTGKDSKETKVEKTVVGEDKTSIMTSDETVYLITSPDGKVKQTIIGEKEQLHYDDYDNYKLPIEMDVTYVLDGEAIAPEKLAGKDGHLKIVINYDNKEKVGNVYVPFLTASTMILDNEKCSNIKVDNGKAIDDGNRTTVMGYAVPGIMESLDISRDKLDLPDKVVVEADIKDFQLEGIMTMATSEIFADMDLDEVKSIGDIDKTIDELDDGVDKLVDGTSKLYDGTSELKEKTKDLVAGTNKLAAGSKELYGGTKQLKEGIVQLDAGISKLTENNQVLNQGAKQITDTLIKSADASIEPVRKAFQAMGQDIPGLTVENYSKVIDGVVATLNGIDKKKGTTENAGTVKQLMGAKAQLDSIAGFYNGLVSYTAGVEQAGKAMPQLKAGAEGLSDGAGSLNDGFKVLTQGQEKLVAGVGALNDGAKELKKGVSKMEKEMSDKLKDLDAKELSRLINRTREMGRAAKAYNGYADLGSFDSVKFIFRAEAIEK